MPAATAARHACVQFPVESGQMDENIAFEEIIKKTEKLPTLPGVALKLMDALRKEEPDLNEITKLISSDPSLSAEVLKCINSPFYSLQAKITSVNHAVNMMGFSAVKNLALSCSLVKNFQPDGPFGFDYNSYWKDSLIGAVSAKALADDILPDLAEDAFLLGLLHNVGILTLARCLPKQYNLVIKEMQTSGCAIHEAEDIILGFNHMSIGRCLIEFWKLPELLYLPIGCHHRPEKLSTDSSEINTLTQILHLATLFIDLFNDIDKCLTLGLIELHAKKYQFEDKINIEQLGQKIHDHTQQLFPLFEINVENQEQYSELLDEEIYRSRRYKFPLTIVFADINDLKSINDKFGHPAGDYVIKAIADCLRKELRQSDHIARYGADEFGIILPETALEGGLKAAERLKIAIGSLKVTYDKKTIPFNLSFGVSSLPPDQEVSKDKFIKMADKALTLAKANGQNQCFAVKA